MDWVTEIDELHAFFEDFFLARESSMQRVEQALAPGFTMISPDGSSADRSAVLEAIRAGHGHTAELRIVTSDHALIVESDDLVVAVYVETHHLTDRRNDRRTTVVFEKDEEGPNGVRWLHAQETFMPSLV